MTTTITDYAALSTAQLSALVAKRVMGWRWDGDGWVAHKTARSLAWFDNRTGGRGRDFDITDPAAYMAVVDAMRGRGWHWQIRDDLGPVVWVEFFTVPATRDHDAEWMCVREMGEASFANIGRAIAIAALRALEGER